MSISFHVHGQDAAVGVLFMSPLESVRGVKLEGYNVDGVAVLKDNRGQGIGTLLMQVAKEEAMLAAQKAGREVKETALNLARPAPDELPTRATRVAGKTAKRSSKETQGPIWP